MVRMCSTSRVMTQVISRQAVCVVVRNTRVRLVHPPETKDTSGKATANTNPTKKKPKANATKEARTSRLRKPLLKSTLRSGMIANPRNYSRASSTPLSK